MSQDRDAARFRNGIGISSRRRVASQSLALRPAKTVMRSRPRPGELAWQSPSRLTHVNRSQREDPAGMPGVAQAAFPDFNVSQDGLKNEAGNLYAIEESG
jgi:hypothetical protein